MASVFLTGSALVLGCWAVVQSAFVRQDYGVYPSTMLGESLADSDSVGSDSPYVNAYLAPSTALQDGARPHTPHKRAYMRLGKRAYMRLGKRAEDRDLAQLMEKRARLRLG